MLKLKLHKVKITTKERRVWTINDEAFLIWSGILLQHDFLISWIYLFRSSTWQIRDRWSWEKCNEEVSLGQQRRRSRQSDVQQCSQPQLLQQHQQQLKTCEEVKTSPNKLDQGSLPWHSWYWQSWSCQFPGIYIIEKNSKTFQQYIIVHKNVTWETNIHLVLS